MPYCESTAFKYKVVVSFTSHRFMTQEDIDALIKFKFRDRDIIEDTKTATVTDIAAVEESN